MRLVYEISWKHGPEVGGRVLVGTNHPYIGPCAEEPRWRGAKAEVHFFNGSDKDEDLELVVEGSIEDLKASFKEALEMLETLEEHHKEALEDHRVNSVKCAICGTWYDKRDPLVEHVDGRGNTCLGDGTVLMSSRPILMQIHDTTEQTSWLPLEDFKPIRAGNLFKLKDPCGEEEEGRVFMALEDAKPHFMARHHPPHAWLMVRVKRDPQ